MWSPSPRRSVFALLAAAVALMTGAFAAGGTMTWSDLLARPRPTADARIAYGSDPLQHADLWLPGGKGPHPVVLMVHGGCWQTGIADASIMDWAAAALRERGIAVWNIDYRGVDRPGGGYPGTFQDVAAAADALRSAAPRYRLRLDPLVAFGHSAGGHLALWLAARPRLPAGSPLHGATPLRIDTVISSGGLPDLEAAQTPPGDTCGVEAVHALTGTPGAQRPDVYADTSPVRLAPFPARQILVNATRDRIAPPAFAAAYAAKLKARGATVERVTVPDEGHAELIAPGSAAWTETVKRIDAALRAAPR